MFYEVKKDQEMSALLTTFLTVSIYLYGCVSLLAPECVACLIYIYIYVCVCVCVCVCVPLNVPANVPPRVVSL